MGFSSPIGYDTIHYAVTMKNPGLNYSGLFGEKTAVWEALQFLFVERVGGEVSAMEELISLIEDKSMLLYYLGVTIIGGS